jgi:hypothetical protein
MHNAYSQDQSQSSLQYWQHYERELDECVEFLTSTVKPWLHDADDIQASTEHISSYLKIAEVH